MMLANLCVVLLFRMYPGGMDSRRKRVLDEEWKPCHYRHARNDILPSIMPKAE